MFDIKLSSPLLKGLLIAVPLGPFVFALLANSRLSLNSSEPQFFLGFCILCFLIGTLFVFGLAVLFAVPALLLLQHFRVTSVWVFCFTGGVTAVVALVALLLGDKYTSLIHVSAYVQGALAIFLWGALYGLVIWLVARPRSNPAFERTGRQRRASRVTSIR
jgi:hypothetical protein